MILRFPAASVRALVDHALAAPSHRLTAQERGEVFGLALAGVPQPGEADRGSPALWLINLAGIDWCLVSNGIPGHEAQDLPIVVPSGDRAPPRELVVALLGGRNLGQEVIPLALVEPVLKAGQDEIVIRLKDGRLAVDRPVEAKSGDSVWREIERLRLKHQGRILLLGRKKGAQREKIYILPGPWSPQTEETLASSFEAYALLETMPRDAAIAAYARAMKWRLASDGARQSSGT